MKILLVDVDEDNDISSAYRMDNEDFPFGYEFVRKATLREINFGESDMTGEKLSVSGVEEVRKGFRYHADRRADCFCRFRSRRWRFRC